jgi:hypothetical protein
MSSCCHTANGKAQQRMVSCSAADTTRASKILPSNMQLRAEAMQQTKQRLHTYFIVLAWLLCRNLEIVPDGYCVLHLFAHVTDSPFML